MQLVTLRGGRGLLTAKWTGTLTAAVMLIPRVTWQQEDINVVLAVTQ